MGEPGCTEYFLKVVIVRRPYVTIERCRRVIDSPERIEIQEDGGIRFWAILPEFGGRAPRVVTLSDRRTIHNAFLDRRYPR